MKQKHIFMVQFCYTQYAANIMKIIFMPLLSDMNNETRSFLF